MNKKIAAAIHFYRNFEDHGLEITLLVLLNATDVFQNKLYCATKNIA